MDKHNYLLVNKAKSLKASTFKKTGVEVEYTYGQLESFDKQMKKDIDAVTRTINLNKVYTENIERNHDVIKDMPEEDKDKAQRVFELMAEGEAPKEADCKYGLQLVAIYEYFRSMNEIATLKKKRELLQEKMNENAEVMKKSKEAYGK